MQLKVIACKSWAQMALSDGAFYLAITVSHLYMALLSELAQDPQS